MASNTFDLNDALTKQTQFQAAKYGTGGLLDVLLGAYQAAAPRAPFANLLMGARQAYNIGQYNNSVKAEQKRQLERQQTTDANDAANFNDQTGRNISGPFSHDLAIAGIPNIRKGNATQSINNLLHGGDLTLDAHGDYDPGLVTKYLGQQGSATNYLNQNAGLGAIASGQGQSLLGAGLANLVNSKLSPNSPMRMGVMPNGQGISTGISKSAPPDQIDTTSSPFLMPTDVPSNIASGQRAGLQDAQANATNAETVLHNRTSEKETARNHRATEGIGRTNAAAHMISARKPSGAGRALQATDLMTPEQQKQYAARIAAGPNGSPPVVPSASQWLQLEHLRRQAEGSDGILGFGKQAPDMAAAQRYNGYAKKYGLTPINIGGSAPFGNQSGSKLQGNQASLSSSIYPGRTRR